MDSGSLVESRIEDGRYLLEKLVASDFDVTAAAWLQSADEKWSLYVVSKAVDDRGLAAARSTASDILRRVKPFWASDSNLHLEGMSSSFARSVFEIRKRLPANIPVPLSVTRVGDVVAAEVYLYPAIERPLPGQEPLTPGEVVQKVVGLMSRNGAVRPSRFTLRDGSEFFGVPFGLEKGGGNMNVKFTVEGFEPPRVCPVEAIQVIE